MPLLVKGDLVRLVLTDKRVLVLPDRHGMIHDPTGKLLDKCDIVIGPYVVSGDRVRRIPDEVKKAARSYFGDRKRLKHGSVVLPIGPWHRLGEVERIFYKRYGKHRGMYFHDFETPVTLLSNGSSYYKLRLPEGCVVNDRGYVWP